VTPSEWLSSKVKLSFLRDKPIIVIPNGIDQDIFKPRDFTDLEIYPSVMKKKVILSVASDIMSENKGGQRVLDIADRIQNKDIVFILIGGRRPKNYYNENVIFINKTKNQIELAKFYSLSTCLLILSKSETFALTVAEALSCGTPIIGYDSGGIKETIVRGNGSLFSFGDIESILKSINELQFNQPFKKSIAEKYDGVLSKNKMMDNYIKVYNENIVSW
jgi:glycosyltransferase involved in cell wall biosynthesis